MKQIIMGLVLASTIAIPALSQANLGEIRFRHVIRYELATECAVEVEIRDIEGGFINGTETLKFDDKDVADNSALTLQAGYSIGDSFLYASPAFAGKFGLSLGVDYDGEISDDDCSDLLEDSKISYRGSFGQNAASLSLNGFDLHWSFSYNLNTDDYEEVDLQNFSINVTSSFDTWDLGTGPLFPVPITGTGTSGTGSGCTLTAGNHSSSGMAVGFIIMGALLVLGLRRRQSQSHA